MSTNTVIAIIAALIILGGGAYYFMQAPADTAMQKEDAMMKDDAMMQKDTMQATSTDDAMMMKDDAMMQEDSMMSASGSYEAYASNKVAMASASHDVVLFFRASWCPTCKAVDADIKAHLKEIPQSLTILDVNYDTESALKKKYGVTYQHTFVQVDAEGTLIKKWSASPTLAALVSEVK